MKILGYSELTAQEVKGIRKFFSQYPIININSDIKEKAIKLRRDFDLKLPDSIIAATTDSLEIPLFTADTDFKKLRSHNIIFYDSGE